MKTDEMNLTVAELDKLCRLYMDCKLSVLEEKELEYVLFRTPLTSTSIEEVRTLMGIHMHPICSSTPARAKRNWSWWHSAGIAASVAIVFGLSLMVFSPDIPQSSGHEECIAYVNGHEIQGDAAVAHIEAETRKVEEFINRMAQLEEEEQNKIEQFMNHQNNMQ